MPTGFRGIGWDADPFTLLRSLQENFARGFPASWPYGLDAAPETESFPKVNVWTNGNRAIVAAELPGVEPDKVDLSVLGNTVTLRGTRAALEAATDASVIKRERSRGEFMRSIELPFAVEAEHVEAKYRNGILTVTLPRAEAERPKKISVRTA